MTSDSLIDKLDNLTHGVSISLCILFIVLFGVWLQPETVAIRNTCLVLGALLSLPIIYLNRQVFLQKKILPVFLIILLLLLWVTFHLFFLGTDFQTQLKEYSHAWKKIAISIVFALGLGVSLNSRTQGNSKERNQDRYFELIYFGFSMPVIIYFIKLVITLLALHYGWHVSPYLIKSDAFLSYVYGIPRAGHVFFTLPVLAISLHLMSNQIIEKNFLWKKNVVYITMVLATILIYIIEKDRIGHIFVIGLLVIFSWGIIKNLMISKSYQQLRWIALGSVVALFFLVNNLEKNPQWKTFISDAKVAIQVDRYDNWKYNTPDFLSLNDQGVTASDSNYKRISWLIIGSNLAITHPFGYGLMGFSFGRIGKSIWPDSQMSWSHSAWLDFTLGYGWIGLALFLGAALLIFVNSRDMPQPWKTIGRSVVGTWIALFFVKELSIEIYINAFIFIIVFATALSVDLKSLPKTGG